MGGAGEGVSHDDRLHVLSGALRAFAEATTDYERLLGAAEQRARRLLVFSYPPRNTLSRLFVSTENLVFKLLRKEYRSFVHPPAAMLGLLDERGLRRTFAVHTAVWQVAGLER